MALRVYNTLTRQKEPFETVQPGKVGMYVCGPTVYKPSHVGHMVGPVIFDSVKRYLTYLGYQVTWVVNITDVDDKLIVRAKELGTTVKELAEKMTADYREALRKLNVTTIDLMPKATEHIPQMITIMEGLIAKGHAYASGGDVYFDVTKDPDYGKLCHRDPEQMEAGARIEVTDKKRNPGDFALWKSAKPGEPAWDSPWGPGRPGWHIECSAMSMQYLGQTLDIHGGGLDLQFPHHENELAQSESYTDVPFVRYWMHNGLLKMGHAKMAGSVGNVVNVADLFRQYQPETVRFLLLSTHYRSPIEWSDERLAEVRRALDSFDRFFERYERVTGESFYAVQSPWQRREDFNLAWASPDWAVIVELRQKFFECLDDDFNTGGAIGALYELLTALNRIADQKQLEGAGAGVQPTLDNFKKGVVVLRELSQILGLFLKAPEAQSTGADQLVNGLMQLLIDLRAEARKAKNFALADRIRQGLGQLGITLEDRPGGTGSRLNVRRYEAWAMNRPADQWDRPTTGGGLPQGIRILGIDPGLQVTGYGVLEVGPRGPIVCEAGIVRSSEGRATTDMAHRVRSLYDSIVEILKQFQPAVVAVEQLYAHYDHPRTAILMAHARGVIFLAAAQQEVPVVSYNATRIKKTVTGNGRAPKDQVQRTVQRELGLARLPEPSDVADALAAALCHYYVQVLPGGEKA